MTVIRVHPETFRIAGYLGFWSMVLLAMVVHKSKVNVDMSNTPLMQVLGYNNICVYWDYSPSREITAMYYPMVEYPLVAYVVLTGIQYYQSRTAGLIPRWLYICLMGFLVLQLPLLAWFRMIFVIDALKDLKGHTLGFLGLQMFLSINALQNALYNHWLGTSMQCFGRMGTRIIGWLYVLTLVLVTCTKQALTLAIFAGNPLIDNQTPVGAAVSQAIDVMWMLLAAVLPLVFAIIERKKEPGLKFELSLDHRSAVVVKGEGP